MAVAVMLIFGIIPFLELDGPASAGVVTGGDLVAVYSDSALTFDGSDADASWAAATSLSFEVKKGRADGTVLMKAVYTDTDIYVYATWADVNMSVLRGGSWSWNGSAWSTGGGSEDRLAILWDINITGFADEGCTVPCHAPTHDAMYLENEGELGDMWHMKSARSLGATSVSQVGTATIPTTGDSAGQATAGEFHFTGFADDKHLVAYTGPEGDINHDTGREGDAGTETYARNRNSGDDGQNAPKYMEIDPTDYLDAMILQQSEVDGGQTIDANWNSSTYAGDDAVNTSWAKYVALSAVVPERVLSPPTGSRGDVEQSAIWTAGVWTTEFKRSLDTGNSDDVQFSDLTAGYLFAVAVMNNGGGDGHSSTESRVYTLTFSEKPSEPDDDDDDDDDDGIPTLGFMVVITTLLLVAGVAEKKRRRRA